jgi:hypothetical protein
LPSETTFRNRKESAFIAEILRIKEIVKNEQIFLVVDETSNDGKYFTSVLIGLIIEPAKTYSICLEVSASPPNSDYIVKLVEDILISEFQILPDKFLVLLSDAARYMQSAGNNLKKKFMNLFHFTCIAHLYHYVFLRISSYYKELNFLIASIKTTLNKSKKRQRLFNSIGFPSDTIVTR